MAWYPHSRLHLLRTDSNSFSSTVKVQRLSLLSHNRQLPTPTPLERHLHVFYLYARMYVVYWKLLPTPFIEELFTERVVEYSSQLSKTLDDHLVPLRIRQRFLAGMSSLDAFKFLRQRCCAFHSAPYII